MALYEILVVCVSATSPADCRHTNADAAKEQDEKSARSGVVGHDPPRIARCRGLHPAGPAEPTGGSETRPRSSTRPRNPRLLTTPPAVRSDAARPAPSFRNGTAA